MESEFPAMTALRHSPDSIATVIKFAVANERPDALERLCSKALLNLKQSAPTVFAECTMIPFDHGFILVISPCRKHLRFINHGHSLESMEVFYTNHSCEICPEKICRTDINIGKDDQFAKGGWSEYSPGVFYKNCTDMSVREWQLSCTTKGITAVQPQTMDSVVAAHNEIVDFLAKMKIIGANLPQPIVEEIHAFYHDGDVF